MQDLPVPTSNILITPFLIDVYKKILSGLEDLDNVKIIANGDLPIFAYDKMDSYKKVYYGIRDKRDVHEDYSLDAELNSDGILCPKCNSVLKYRLVNYSSLGDFTCPSCDFSSKNLKYCIDNLVKLESDHSTFKIANEEYEISVGGLYNIYNALCAYSITKELNIDDSFIKKSLESQSSSFGRQEIINIDDKEAKIILVKNPAGYNQALDTLCLNKEPFSCAFLLNDNYADGRDVSWIWDVNFENLNNVKLDEVYVSGLRTFDMAVRLKTAGISPSKFVIEEEYENLTNQIKNGKNKKIYILATYTAMINYRKYLHSKGYIKNLW